MKTTKERLAVAIQTPLKDSLAFYHTSLKGLDQSLYRDKTTKISDWLCMCGSGWWSICIVFLLSLF